MAEGNAEEYLSKYEQRRRQIEQEERQNLLLEDEVGPAPVAAGGSGTVGDADDDEFVPLRVKRQKLLQRARNRREDAGFKSEEGFAAPDSDEEAHDAPPAERTTLLAQHASMVKNADEDAAETAEIEKAAQEEEKILKSVTMDKPLLAVHEIAKGIQYEDSMTTSWTPTQRYARLTPAERQAERDKLGILVDGDDVPPLIHTFKEMKLPKCIVNSLKKKDIVIPTPIQMQGLPVILSGRDMIGIAFTGTGKTLAFILPLVMLAVEEEMKMPITGGEGPIGVVVCPSRELARQIYEGCLELTEALREGGYPYVKSVLCMGGVPMREQDDMIRRGFHICIATPGRLVDCLNRKKFTMDACKYLCMDEADRMVDMGFEEEIRNVMNHFRFQRQTVLFSATMPIKIQKFAKSALVKPVLVNVGRAGAANLNVVQEVEFVRQEQKMTYLLVALQKTPPPVLIFAEHKDNVDAIQEYLLLKGVEAVATHGGKDQEERTLAVKKFKNREADVLVATDVASKGLDFADVQHVINYDMPREIENYVHRIGRTGRSGRTGLATTFINNVSCTPTILLDLKHLLIEAKQRVPPFFMALDDADRVAGGCGYCGGLGHRITDCPKLEKERQQKVGDIQRAASGARGGDW